MRKAGIGASASATAQVSKDGLLEFGGSVGGAAGIGGGLSARGGVNPVAIGRLGVLKGMEGVNEGYDGAEKIAKSLRERAARIPYCRRSDRRKCQKEWSL